MTKKKSKQIKQLKYLLLVPVLASMLIYVSCNDTQENEVSVSKQNQKLYFDNGKVHKGLQNLSYLDLYLGDKTPNSQELSYSDLEQEEQEEFNKMKNTFGKTTKLRIFKGESNRKIIRIELISGGNEIKEQFEKSEDVPFSIIDTAPTFPGCPEGDKDCFNKKMQEFVQQNFNVKQANSLGLSKGKQRIYLQFKIAKDGKITKINARAPHPELKEEAIRLAKKIPIMQPGKNNGNAVRVGYTLPITFIVE